MSENSLVQFNRFIIHEPPDILLCTVSKLYWHRFGHFVDYPVSLCDYSVLEFKVLFEQNDKRPYQQMMQDNIFFCWSFGITIFWANSISEYTFTGVSLLQQLKSSAPHLLVIAIVTLANLWHLAYFSLCQCCYQNFQLPSILLVDRELCCLGVEDILFWKPPWNFSVFYFTPGNSSQNKSQTLDIPQNFVRSLGNSKTKNKNPWKFCIIFSWLPSETQLSF